MSVPSSGTAGDFTFAPLASEDAAAWSQFAASARTATLFHDLRFLAYHPAGRFAFEHLLARTKGRISALIPGGIAERDGKRIFTSPLGASVGGPVTGDLALADALGLIEAWQAYARERGWDGISLTLPPAAYDAAAGDLLAFALFARGFRLEHRWLCYLIDIAAAPQFSRGMRDNVRTARRLGVVARAAGAEALDDFFAVFDDTYARHGVAPTHSHEELRRLFELVPERLLLVMSYEGTRPVAGIFLMLVNPRVAYSFYICNSTERAEARGVSVAFVHAFELLRERGYRYLDTGPGSSDIAYNHGVSFFKEGLGAKGHCRDRWTWNA